MTVAVLLSLREAYSWLGSVAAHIRLERLGCCDLGHELAVWRIWRRTSPGFSYSRSRFFSLFAASVLPLSILRLPLATARPTLFQLMPAPSQSGVVASQ